MAHDDSDSQIEWWKTLQALDMTKVRHLFGIHPHLIWTRLTDPVFRPVDYDTFLETFGGDLGSYIDLNSLHWLLFYYHSHIDVKSLVLDILNKITMDDLAMNEEWGNQKNTLLHLVSALGYDDLTLLLLDKGVSADVPNALGRLPYHVARTNTMANLLDISYETKKSVKTSHDDHNSSPSGAAQQQQLQRPSPSTSIEASSSSSAIETPTIKKPNKDGHYFRAGHVEETKQKVLTDEQVELQKQRERRRKDIAQLAKRSAVKNNPFVKKSEPSLAQASFRQRSSGTSSSTTHSNDTTTNDDISGTSSSSKDTMRDRKHKRNSKVINSLQTKSYVSSSIFRQGEPSGGGNSLRHYLIQSQDKHRDPNPAMNEPPTDTKTTHNATLEHLPESHSTPSATLDIPSMIRDDSIDTEDSGNNNDGDSSEKYTNIGNIPSAKNLQQDLCSTSTTLELNNETSTIPENSPSPSSSSTTSLVSASTSISTSLSKSSSTFDDPLIDQHISTSTETPPNDDLVSSTINTPMPPTPPSNATNDLSSKAKNIGNKRQSGSQKTHWSNELASWESVLNHEFDLDKKGETQGNGNPTRTAALASSLAHLSLKHGGGNGELNDIEDGNNKMDLEYHQQQQQQQRHNKNGLDDDGRRRQGGNGTMFESSRLPLKSYGSVSVKSMATYSRRLPTFDAPTVIGKSNDSPTMLSQIDNTLDISGGEGLTSLTTPKPSAHHRRRYSNHDEKEMTRSASVSNTSLSLSSTTTHTASEHYQQPKTKSSTIPAYLTTTGDSNNINSKRGKLYIRVHGVHDILLPLPRDRAHVRCVIGDGRYEYMSKYEILGQDMTFGYECIIDSHPDMIVTLSLHVRPDYMLKKPLTRLFTANRKRKGSLSAYVSSEDGAVGQTRFVVGDMLSACHRRSYSASFHCFNAWYIHSGREKSSSRQQEQEQDQGVLKVIGNFDVELLYLPVSDPSLPVPKNLRECDMTIKMQHWNETRMDTDHYPKIQRAPLRLAQEKSLWSMDQ